MSQDLCNPSLRLSSRTAKICKLHHYLMARYSPLAAALRDKYIPGKLHIIRHNKAKIFTFLKISYNLTVCVLQPPDHRPFRTASFLSIGCDHDLHPISMQGSPGLVLWNKYIPLHSLNCNKSESSGMAAKKAVHRKSL